MEFKSTSARIRRVKTMACFPKMLSNADGLHPVKMCRTVILSKLTELTSLVFPAVFAASNPELKVTLPSLKNGHACSKTYRLRQQHPALTNPARITPFQLARATSQSDYPRPGHNATVATSVKRPSRLVNPPPATSNHTRTDWYSRY